MVWLRKAQLREGKVLENLGGKGAQTDIAISMSYHKGIMLVRGHALVHLSRFWGCHIHNTETKYCILDIIVPRGIENRVAMGKL